MNDQRKRQIDEMLQAALDLRAEERAAFLSAACDGDAELRRKVETLLRLEAEAADFIETPLVVRPAVLLEGQQIGHYKIEARIGAGGMGEVWKAWDDRLKREVAIKILPQEFAADPERIARFQQEAHVASALNHANIITIHEVGQVAKQDGELYFIVTEFIVGLTLREYLAQPDKVRSWRDAVLIATQIASALSAAHAADLIHRDIKPENIMVQPNRQVKVLDFGIAKLSGGMRDEATANIPLHPSSLPHCSWRAARHRAVYVAGASAGRAARRTHGYLLARRGAL